MLKDDLPPSVVKRWEKFGPLRYRAKKETRSPCAVCGWASHMAIHLPVDAPVGHAYEVYVPPGVATDGGAKL